MCLNIDLKFHPGNSKSRKPFVAKQPILVYKSLHYSNLPNSTYGVSPYQGTAWHFGREKTVGRFTYRNRYRENVEAGLHAFTSVNANRASRVSYKGKKLLFPAVIPAGALVWLGEGDEIATNRMTVYRDDAELFAALGITGYAPGIKKADAANG